MSIKRRIAVLMGQPEEEYQSRFSKGFINHAHENNYDVCVFAMYLKYQENEVREKAESNIFNLINYELFDGVVILKDTIQTTGVAERLEETLHSTYNKPVVVIESESKYFDSIRTSGYLGMYNMVSHMIEEHGYKNIFFLGGKKWHKHSIERVDAYKAAMKDHGLNVDEARDIMYGDFWYKSGEQCADKLLVNRDELPEAVVCANDCMAIGLARALDKEGIRIPEDVAIAGYDATEEGRTSPVPITSVIVPAYECGKYAFDYIDSKIRSLDFEEKEIVGGISIGESCGCRSDKDYLISERRTTWSTDISRGGFLTATNAMPDDLLLQNNLMDYLSTVYSYAYQISGVNSFHLCLNSAWRNMDEDYRISCKNEGYSQEMIYAIKYNNDGMNGLIGLDVTFNVKDILPELLEDSDEPRVFFFEPIFYEDQCYGYAAIGWEKNGFYADDASRLWMGTVSRGFEMLRRTTVLNSLLKVTEKQTTQVRKFENVLNAAMENLSEEEKDELKLVEHILDDNLLKYHFQPIVNTTDGSIYSYEALMRPNTEQWISPLSIIKYANILNRINDVEKATFMNVLNIVSDKKDLFKDRKVFINSIPGVRVSDEDLSHIEGMLKSCADTAVVELTEEAELSDDELEKTKNFFKKLNIQTAVDDYGTGYSNVTNLLRYMPDYVKIDRSLLTNIHNEPQKQHFVREIIDYCHDNNIKALAEGVETTEELQMVIHLGADLIQGYYTAKPNEEIITRIDDKVRNEIKRYRQEFIDGVSRGEYIAGKSARISLSKLVKDGCTDIVVGEGNMVYNDFTIIGTPGSKTNIHLIINPDYKGRIQLENVFFTNVKNQPSIEVSEGADVTLILKGVNVLKRGGIQVKESASLTLEGDGDMEITVDSNEYYGIGNDMKSRHGDIFFKHDGKVKIRSNGMKGVCIGSGLGGNIAVSSGQFIIEPSGESAVAIGAFDGDVNMNVDCCLMEAEISVSDGVFIGSYNGNANITVSKSRLESYVGGQHMVVIGTINGEKADITLSEMSIDAGIRSDDSTCLGANNGESSILIDRAGVTVDAMGKNALIFGGHDKSTTVDLRNSHTKTTVHNALDLDTYAKEEDFKIVNGRGNFVINDKILERYMIYDIKI